MDTTKETTNVTQSKGRKTIVKHLNTNNVPQLRNLEYLTKEKKQIQTKPFMITTENYNNLNANIKRVKIFIILNKRHTYVCFFIINFWPRNVDPKLKATHHGSHIWVLCTTSCSNQYSHTVLLVPYANRSYNHVLSTRHYQMKMQPKANAKFSETRNTMARTTRPVFLCMYFLYKNLFPRQCVINYTYC